MTQEKLCDLKEIPEGTTKEFFVETDGAQKPLMVLHLEGNLQIYKNSCPHIGVPLNMAPDRFLDADGQYIQCSTHGALFKIEDGECVHGPCLGQFLEAVPFELKGEEVFINKGF